MSATTTLAPELTAALTAAAIRELPNIAARAQESGYELYAVVVAADSSYLMMESWRRVRHSSAIAPFLDVTNMHESMRAYMRLVLQQHDAAPQPKA